MENKKETKKEKIMQVIDVFFVMILCFVVLLVTMLFQNLAGVKEAGKAYVIQASTLVPVVVALAAYVTFLVKRSKKDLKEIIELEYSERSRNRYEHMDNYKYCSMGIMCSISLFDLE